MSDSQVKMLLERGVAHAKRGDEELARELLLRVVKLDESNELAWLWPIGPICFWRTLGHGSG